MLPPDRPAASRREFAVKTGLLLLLLPQLVVAAPSRFPAGFSTDCTKSPLADYCHPSIIRGLQTVIDITTCVQLEEENVMWSKVCDDTTCATTRDKNKNHLLVDITALDTTKKLWLMVKTNGNNIWYSKPLPLTNNTGIPTYAIAIIVFTVYVFANMVVAKLYGPQLCKRLRGVPHFMYLMYLSMPLQLRRPCHLVSGKIEDI